MIKFTIKTLDSYNHNFSVDDETTVSQLKERIRDELGIDINLQRLIFCGRVMQDDHTLTHYNVDGKVIHLVQRPPPSTTTRQAPQPTQRDPPIRHHIRHLWSVNQSAFANDPNQSTSHTSGRIVSIRHTIDEIRATLTALQAHVSNQGGLLGQASVPEPMEVVTEAPAPPPPTNETNTENTEEPYPTMEQELEANRIYPRVYRSMLHRNFRMLLVDLDSLYGTFAPYRSAYIAWLSDVPHREYPEEERTHHQRTVDMVHDLMHSFGHAYHAISDINLRLEEDVPRLSSEPPTTRHPIPMQAHINVVQHSRRPGQPGFPIATFTGNGAGNRRVTAEMIGNLQIGIAPDSFEDMVRVEDASHNTQQNGAAGRNNQPTFNNQTFNVNQSEPVTYQVEIETRVPIALPIDNALLNGLAAVATNLQEQQNQAQASQPTPQPAQPAAQPAQPTQPGGQGQPASQQQRNRTPAQEIENFIRGLTNATNVEVVMSMEEFGGLPTASNIIHGVAPNIIHGPQPEATTASFNIPNEAGAPTAEILQNVITTLLRPNFNEMNFVPRRPGDTRPTFTQIPFGTSLFAAANASIANAANAAAAAAAASNTGTSNTATSATGTAASTATAAATATATATATAPATATATAPANASDIATATAPATATVAATAVTLASVTVTPSINIGGNVIVVATPSVTNSVNMPATATSVTATTTATTENTNTESVATAVSTNVTAPTSATATTTAGETVPPTTVATPTATATASPAQDENETSNASEEGWPPPPTQAELDANRRTAEPNEPQRESTENQRRGRPSLNRRHHSLRMSCIVYDRYLYCDNPHARRHLQERRQQYQERAEAEERARLLRTPPPDIEMLSDMQPNFTQRHMTTMMRLLAGPVSPAGRVNAFMVAVARNVFFGPLNTSANDPTPMPAEFQFIRLQLRDYVSGLLNFALERSSHANPFESVTERIIQHHREFLRNMHTITPINPDVNPIGTIHTMTRSRIPAIIACVMSESYSDMFSARFYSVISRLFTDICTVFLHFCSNGFGGLLQLYEAFVAQITESFDEDDRTWLRLLGRQNLLAIRQTLEPNLPAMRIYFQHSDRERTPGPTVPTVSRPVAEQQDMPMSERGDEVLPHICENHQRITMPLQAPPLLPPPTMHSDDIPRNDVPIPLPDVPSDKKDDETPKPDSDATAGAHGESPTLDMQQNEPETRTEKEQESSEGAGRTVTLAPNGDGASGTSTPARQQSETSSSRSTPDSMRFVPPVILLQQWDEEWVPMFTRDQRAQREREEAAEPYSDAYLSGMPSRKRRCVRQNRAPTTLDGFLNESIREATERAISMDQRNIRGVLRESVRSLVRNRASSSEDYDPVRFAAAARFMDQSKSNNESDKTGAPDSMD